MSLIRIFAFITILAALASIYVGIQLKTKKAEDQEALQAEQNTVAKLTSDLGEEKKTRQETESKLTDKSKKLEDANTEISQSKAKIDSLASKISDTESKLTDVSKQLSAKQAEIEKIQKSIPEGMTIDQIQPKLKELTDQLTSLDQEKAVLNEQLSKLDSENKKLQEQAKLRREGKLPAGLMGRILDVNEEWNYVVLDIGANQGVVENATMIVYRNGVFVGKIKITSVEPSTSIGDVLPDWKKDNVQAGDSVTP